MAQPSSSQRERERERSERSSRHHHHRTISSTTLLLVLSLVLAVLAVMLTLPNTQTATGGATGEGGQQQGVWGILTPKRSQVLIGRESDVAKREAEVARREAEILAGAPGGVLQTPQCPPCPSVIEKVTEAPLPPPPVQTVIKEVFREEALTPPGWWDQARIRAEDILDRELKIAEREREISRREEAVNRREHDASRRENWIMEQLVVLNSDEPAVEEEEFVYEPGPPSPKRKAKVVHHAPQFQALPPPLVVTETAVEVAFETETVTFTEHHTHTLPTKTVTVPAPANTRIVASPAPEAKRQSSTPSIPRTTSIERVIEEVVDTPSPIMEEIEEEEEEEAYIRMGRPRRTPNSWFGW
ncbi:uncharacterized protein PHACADRAFT_256152 [Phanerochaete carnosa HHB-10118-sp]|uniref:Uncharacterized protein n=1 Tax=Phanerochaete carnosa (strain HHB-10118-sp) TaxID=650164 RepID=K5W945_PHACS|nr:uncharacterized protein PHACADRAFT_256152 [Phanerochaete carnosa HHB-10118-sp]EKM55494.1 hypothetical protein PHACADRAFT_256152 [Phanerochaete carnosa HHB-10118-sp]